VHFDAVFRLGVHLALAALQELVRQARRGLLRVLRRRCDVLRHWRRLGHLLDRDQLHIEHQHACRGSWPTFVGEVLGNPEPVLGAGRHQLQTLGPAFDHLTDAERGRRAALHRRVEHLSVGLPACVVHRHTIVFGRVLFGFTGFLHHVRETRRRLDGFLGRGCDIGRRRDRLLTGDDLQELYVEHEHALWAAGLAFVGQILRDPHAALFARDHQLQTLGPAGDDLLHAELGRLTALHGRVEHLPVGGPAAVVHFDFVPGLRLVSARARAEDFGGQARRRARRVCGGRCDIRRCRDIAFFGRSSCSCFALPVSGWRSGRGWRLFGFALRALGLSGWLRVVARKQAQAEHKSAARIQMPG
jgi:hypothetical protein